MTYPMKTMPVDQLRALLSYDPETGALTWLRRTSGTRGDNIFNSRFAGTEAFTAVNAYGHRHGTIKGVRLYAHRLIWAISTGAWPEQQIDHINGVCSDNRLSNLRVASPAQNRRNQGARSSSLSSFSGVFVLPSGSWQAVCAHTSLGTFDREDDAARAYDTAARRKFGEFARLNFPEGEAP